MPVLRCSTHPTMASMKQCLGCQTPICRLCHTHGNGYCGHCSQPQKQLSPVAVVQAQMALLALVLLTFVFWTLTWEASVRIDRSLPDKPDLPILQLAYEDLPKVEAAKPSLVFSNLDLPSHLSTDAETKLQTKEKSEAQPKRNQVKKAHQSDLAGRFLKGSSLWRYNLDEIPQSGQVLVLSFDGDHMANCVDQILAVLAEKKVKANMFLTGSFVERFPEATLKIKAAGHEMGNHTFSHPRLTSYEQTRTQKTLPTVDRDMLADQLQRTNQAYKNLTGENLEPYWRAPYGEHNSQIRGWAYAEGYIHIGWSRGFDSLDWFHNTNSKYYWDPDELKARLLRKMAQRSEDGKILLFHLGSKRVEKDQPHHMLGEFIDEARRRGFRFSTIAEMLNGTLGVYASKGDGVSKGH